MLSPRGRGVGHRWGIWFFEQIFNQMPHYRAINIGQIPHHFAINHRQSNVMVTKMLIKIPMVGMHLMIKYPTYAWPHPPPGVNIDRCINIFLLSYRNPVWIVVCIYCINLPAVTRYDGQTVKIYLWDMSIVSTIRNNPTGLHSCIHLAVSPPHFRIYYIFW